MLGLRVPQPVLGLRVPQPVVGLREPDLKLFLLSHKFGFNTSCSVLLRSAQPRA